MVGRKSRRPWFNNSLQTPYMTTPAKPILLLLFVLYTQPTQGEAFVCRCALSTSIQWLLYNRPGTLNINCVITLATQADAQDPLSLQSSSPALCSTALCPNKAWYTDSHQSVWEKCSFRCLVDIIYEAFDSFHIRGIKYERSFTFHPKKRQRDARKEGNEKV